MSSNDTAKRDSGSSVVGVPDLLVLRQGLPFAEMERRIGIAYAVAGLKHRVVAFYLAEVDRRGLHQDCGCRTASQYATLRFGMSRREARDLLRAGRALLELRLVDEAFAEGRLCWSKVRELVKVATPEHETKWLDLALGASIDELTLAVRLARRGEAPRSPDDRKGLPEVRMRIDARVPPEIYAKWEHVRRVIEEEAEKPLAEWEYFEAVLDEVLAHREKGATPEEPGRPRAAAPRYAVVLHVGGTGDAIVETEEGAMPVSRMAAELIACGADHFDPATPDTGATREVPERLRKTVMARDHCRCRCCGGRHALQIHHVIPWAAGGPTAEGNLIVLCRRCHALVHAGLLTIEGEAREARFVNRHGEDVHASGAPPDLHQALDLPACVCEGEEEGALASLCDLPAALDRDWWRRHAHLVRFNDRRGSFELCAGRACEEPEGPDENGTMCRAPRLDDLVGQRRTVEALKVALAAAGKRGRPLGHTLLTGPAGLGKTTIARAVAAETAARMHATSGPLLKSPLELVSLLAGLRAGDVLFIDEVHAVPRSIAEVLYEAMADRRLSLTLAAGARVRTVPLSLEPFTLVAATTEPGRLPPPLVSRFRHRQHLEPYGDAELAELVRRSADLAVADDAAARIARVSRGTPREALRVLEHAHDEALHANAPAIRADHVKRALARLGIDEAGLNGIDRKCLGALRSRRGGALSLRSLAALAGLDAEAFQRDHEPYLLRLGLVGTTPRGRVALG